MTVPDLIRQCYERLLGRPCEVSVFVVRKHSNHGYWLVHLVGTAEFYEVFWKGE